MPARAARLAPARHLWRTFLLLLPLALAACDPGQGVGTASDEKPVASIDRELVGSSLTVGQDSTAIGFDVINPAFATALGDNVGRITGVNVHWTSSNPAVAAVTTADVASGAPGMYDPLHQHLYGAHVYVKPVAIGSATITGTVTGAPTVNNATVSTTFTVTVYPVPTKIVATPNPVTVLTTDSATTISASAFGADGTAVPGDPVWTCGDTTVAMVAIAGDPKSVCARSVVDVGSSSLVINAPRVVVLPKKPGTTYVVASYQKSDGTRLTDTVRIVVASRVARVVITPATSSLVVGGTRQLTATAYDAAGVVLTGQTVTWGSRNSGVLTVDAGGMARGIASGATIGQVQSANAFATIGGVTSEVALTVYRKPARVIVAPTPDTLGIGGRVTLRARLVDGDDATIIPLSATSVSWTSDAPAIATVSSTSDSTATVTGVASGATTARVTTETGASGIADIVVRVPVPTSVDLQVITGTTTRPVATTSESIALGSTLPLRAVVRDQNGTATTGAVTWTSSDPTIAAIDANGLVTAKAAGFVTVTARSATTPTVSRSVTIVVVPSTSGPPASMTIAPSPATVKDGAQLQFTATLYDAAGKVVPIPPNGKIGFAVDDSNLASIDPSTGLLSAWETGTTYVRAFLTLDGAQTRIFAVSMLTVVAK